MVDDTTPSESSQAPDAAPESTQTPADVPDFGEYLDAGTFPEPQSNALNLSGDGPAENEVVETPEPAAAETEENLEEEAPALSFDPEPQAGGDGSEGDAPEGYVPPSKPDWIDALPADVKAKAEAQFNGMTKLHREQAEFTAYRAATADPYRAAPALRHQIEAVASRFNISVTDLLTEHVAPELADAFTPAEDPEGEEYEELPETPAVSPQVLAAALKQLGIDPEKVKAQQAELEAKAEEERLQAARSQWLQKTGAPLATHITSHPKGFEVTPEEVQQAYEYAYKANDRDAMKDPLLAVRRMFPDRFAAAEVKRNARPPRARTMVSASGNGAEEISGLGKDDFARYLDSIGVPA